MAKKELKTDTIYMKVTPTLKEQAQQRANEEGRSLSNYIEMLILKDIKEK